MIIYAWVNGEGSLRKAGAKTDPYTIFQSMLALEILRAAWLSS